jgi:hypothetical protein
MTETDVKNISLGFVQQATHFVRDYYHRTEDDTQSVAAVVEVPDFSGGQMEVRYSAAAWDGSEVEVFVGSQLVKVKKSSGSLSVDDLDDTPTPGPLVLALANVITAVGVDGLEIKVIGATTPTTWHIITIFNCATAPEILP